MYNYNRLLFVLVLVAGLALVLSLSVEASREGPTTEIAVEPDLASLLSSDIVTGTQARQIVTWMPMDFNNGLTLDFAPETVGWVTVTLTTTPPVDLPAGGISASWWLTTSAPTYEVTATFNYNHEAFIGPPPGVDVVLALDSSGSLEFDTLCFGCWVPGDGLNYPDGQRNPLPWDVDEDGAPDHCAGSAPVQYDDRQYVVIEAEEYSQSTPSYNRNLYTLGKTYWVIQRNGGRNLDDYGIPYYLLNGDGAGSLGRDELGSYVAYLPPRIALGADGTGVPCVFEDIVNQGVCSTHPQVIAWGGPYPAPHVDYEFTVPISDTWYIWFRGQGGDGNNFIWGLDGVPMGEVSAQHSSSYTNLAHYDRWSWQRAGSQYFEAGITSTLNFWGGDPGSALDRLIITNDSRDPESFFDYNDRVPWDEYQALVTGVLNAPAASVSDNNRTDWACDPCDARFGGSPDPAPGEPLCTSDMSPKPYRYLDDIYDDEQWMRGMVEAAKYFVRGFDLDRDQVGVLEFNSSASIVSDLQCTSRLGVSCTAQVLTDTVIAALDGVHARGTTNEAHALLRGIEMLDPQMGNYAREDTAKALVLVSEGESIVLSGLEVPTCYSEDLWPGNDNSTTVNRAKDCLVYYARQARDAGIVIYTVSMGRRADIELLQHVAEMTGGDHFHAPQAEQLPVIMDVLHEHYLAHLRPHAPRGIYHRAAQTESWALYPVTLTDWLEDEIRARGVTRLSQWTLGPLSPAIAASAEPSVIPADGTTTSTITVDLFGLGFASEWVNFTTSWGSIAPATVALDGRRVVAILTAGMEPATATVTVTAGVVSDTVDVVFQPLSPSTMGLEITPQSLPADGVATATVTATLRDMYGQPVATAHAVTFTATAGGTFPVTETTVNGQVTATYTAGLEPGPVLLTATGGGLSATVELDLLHRPLTEMALLARPSELRADGRTTATVTARLTDTLGLPMANGTVVTFATTLGTLTPLTCTTLGGEATTTLIAGTEPGRAVITVRAESLVETVEVDFRATLYLPLIWKDEG